MNHNGQPATALLGEAILDAIRQAVREEMRALSIGHSRNGHSLLTAEQVARELQVNKATVYEWVKAKQIPFYQVGRFVRFNLQEILVSQKNENPS